MSTLCNTMNRTTKSQKQHEGIALLEVLLAISVIAVGLGAIIETVASGARMQSHIEERAFVQRLAEQKLTELRLGKESGQFAGQFSEPYSLYSWSAEILSSVDGTPFRLIKLRIGSKTEDEKIFSFQSLVSEGG